MWPPNANPADDHILRTSNTEAACLARAGALASGLANHCGCALGQDASRWPKCTASGRLSDHTRTLPTISVVLANHFGCAASYCSCACQLLQLCPHLFGAVAIGLADRPGPSSDSPANHPGCACQPFRLCLPAIAAVLASYYSCAPHLLGAVAIGLADRPGPSSDSPANHPGCACQPFRLCLPAIIAGLASYCSCAHLSRTVAGPLRMMTGTYHLITPGLSIECMRSPFGAPLRFAHSHTPALATVLP